MLLLSERFKEKKTEFLSYFEKYYSDKNLQQIRNFDFIGNKKELQKALKDIYKYGRILGIEKLNEKLDTEKKLNLSFNEKQDKELSEQRAEELKELLNNATVNYLEKHFNNYINDGYTWDDIEIVINSDDFYPLSEKRTELITETERKWAYNLSFLETGKSSGFVDRVLVYDGMGCDTCAELNGEIWTIEQALANPLEHPNCVRHFEYIIDKNSEEE